MPVTKNLELYYMNRPLADLAALKAKSVTGIVTGESVEVVSMSPYGGNFDWILASTATADDINVVLPTGHVGAGRWIRRGFDVQLTAGGKIVASQLDVTSPFLYKGTITVAADFPTLATVQAGWFYEVLANVTDNDPTKTNTGLSFVTGDEIVWNGATWNPMGASVLPVARGGTNSSTTLANGKLMASSGSAIVESAIATPDQDLRTTDSPTFANVTVSNSGQFGFTQPANATFYATYITTVNGDYGLGVLTGTAFGGATILNNSLDLAHNDNRYVSYDAALNASSSQVGAIKFKLTPNYSGTPSGYQAFFSVSAANLSVNNIILLYQAITTGFLTLSIYNSVGTPILLGVSLGAWVPVSGTTYEFELNYDLTTGATRLFIEGIQKGATQTQTGTRDSNIHVLEIGQAVNVNTFTSNFYIDDFIIFNAVQHTANYTPGYTLQSLKVSNSGAVLNSLTSYGNTTLSSLQVANGIAQTSVTGLLSSSTALPNGTTATTQSVGDNTTKVATTAFVQSAITGGVNAVTDAYTPTLGQTVFTLSQTRSADFHFLLTLNGQTREETADFTVVGTTLTWLDPAGLTLKTTDRLIARYYY